jgi:hypothetical protein
VSRTPAELTDGALFDAEFKAWKSLAGYKFLMFGYHAAQWVLINRLYKLRRPNPFIAAVKLARRKLEKLYL